MALSTAISATALLFTYPMVFPKTVSYQPSAVLPQILSACPAAAVPTTAEASSGRAYTAVSCKAAAASTAGAISVAFAADAKIPVPGSINAAHSMTANTAAFHPLRHRVFPFPNPFFTSASSFPFLPLPFPAFWAPLLLPYLVFKKTASRCAFSSSGYSARYCSIASFA